MSFHAWVDALGAESNEYVTADLEAPCLQRLYEKFAGAADVRGGGQHDGLASCRRFQPHSRKRPTMRLGPGVWCASIGVGTQTRIASALGMAEGSVVSLTCSPCRWRIRRSRSRSSKSTRPRLDLSQTTFANVVPDDFCAVVS